MLEDDERRREYGKAQDERIINDQDAEDDIRQRAYDSAEGKILRRERRNGGDDQYGSAEGYVRGEGRDDQAYARMAALEVLVNGIESAKSQAEARERAPRLGVPLDAEKDAANENGDQILHKLNEQELHEAADAVDAPEV